MAELPVDWLAQFVDQVRGASPGQPEWFAGGPRLDAALQLAVYQQQYVQRMVGAVRAEVPGLAHLVGGGIDDLLWAYLGDHPSLSWTLNQVADELPAWLGARGAPRVQVDMARVDLAVQRAFDAADSPPPEPGALLTARRLELAPHVRLLRVGSNVHQVRSRALAGEATDAPVMGVHTVVIHRVARRMRHWGAPRGAFALLEAFEEGLSLADALEQVFARGLLDPERAAADVESWFTTFAKKELLRVP
ncbi:MAG: hypothetical protein ACI8PZ_001909 [Myxococcota bacterium]|jgi:hypothetical protein